MDHYRTLEITLQYAINLHKVNLISRMDVHAVVTISGGDKYSKQKTKTPSDTAGGNNPTWRFPMKFAVEEASLQQNRLLLDFKLVCRSALGEKTVGRVSVPVKELFDGWKGRGKVMSYQVRKPNGKPKGQLRFIYEFGGSGSSAGGLMPPAGYNHGQLLARVGYGHPSMFGKKKAD